MIFAEPLGNPNNKASAGLRLRPIDVETYSTVGFVVLSPCGAKGLTACAGRAPTDERTTKPQLIAKKNGTNRRVESLCDNGDVAYAFGITTATK